MNEAIEIVTKKIEAKEKSMQRYWDANNMDRYRTLDIEIDALKEVLTSLKIAERG